MSIDFTELVEESAELKTAMDELFGELGVTDDTQKDILSKFAALYAAGDDTDSLYSQYPDLNDEMNAIADVIDDQEVQEELSELLACETRDDIVEFTIHKKKKKTHKDAKAKKRAQKMWKNPAFRAKMAKSRKKVVKKLKASGFYKALGKFAAKAKK